MKRIVTILLLSFYLISLTELHQLVKIPILLEHFSEHKQKDNSLSLWEFMAMHYSQEDDHDGDNDKDSKLPFKSHDGCVNSMMIAFVTNGFEDLSAKPIYSESKSYFIYTEKFLQSSYLSAIWQPPKAC